jgi:hypothetical protein
VRLSPLSAATSRASFSARGFRILRAMSSPPEVYSMQKSINYVRNLAIDFSRQRGRAESKSVIFCSRSQGLSLARTGHRSVTAVSWHWFTSGEHTDRPRRTHGKGRDNSRMRVLAPFAPARRAGKASGSSAMRHALCPLRKHRVIRLPRLSREILVQWNVQPVPPASKLFHRGVLATGGPVAKLPKSALS